MRQIPIAKVRDNTKSHLSTKVVGFSIVLFAVVELSVPNQTILLHCKFSFVFFFKLPIIVVQLRRFCTFFFIVPENFQMGGGRGRRQI